MKWTWDIGGLALKNPIMAGLWHLFGGTGRHFRFSAASAAHVDQDDHPAARVAWQFATAAGVSRGSTEFDAEF